MKCLKLSAIVLAGLCFVVLLATGCKEKLGTTWGKSATLGQVNQSDSVPSNDNGSIQPMWNGQSSSANQAVANEVKNTPKTKKD